VETLAPSRDAVDSLSREFALAVDSSGRIVWSDGRAQRMLPIHPGVRLHALVAPGTETKLDALLLRARAEKCEGWEMPMVIGGDPATVTFCAEAHKGGVLLVGHRVPEQFGHALTQLADSMEEVVSLNRQVVGQKKELERRHQQVLELNRDLQESNQGVLTMHSELEDRAQELRHTAEVKTRIVSNVSHEFRTPLHSILGLARLLTEGADGELNAEQAKQVGFIRASAEELMSLVDDLLDLSKTQAGKAALRAERFELVEFFGSLRGMLKPLLPEGSPVALVFEPPSQPVELETDRAKVSQVLRNLVSNALKFTEEGEVRVSARRLPGNVVEIEVADTGIGIEPENLERVFEEFGQVENPIQRRVKGTGLGLPLSRRLAELLGGSLTLSSAPGRGSTFTFTFPAEHPEVRELQQIVERSRSQPAGPGSILVVEDDRKTLFIYEKYLVMAGFHVIPCRTIDEARAAIQIARPGAVMLDIMLEGETSWTFLADLKRDPATHDIPVLVVTVTDREQKARALGADEFWFKPIDQERLLRRLKHIARPGALPRVLVIDDDERARYIVRKHLAGLPYHLIEAETGTEGVSMAQEHAPHVILLDFLLKEGTAFDVLDELKSDPRTRAIPVIIVTSHVLDVTQQRRLLEGAEAVISKQSLSRELALNRIRDALMKSGVATRVAG
jgi:signal transduction histidine kinase/response regulator RpfG family c-di-GMP phosphodiesterase